MVEKIDKLESKVEIQGRDIDVMSKSIEHLASAVGETNVELKEVVKAITDQNVLAERVHNLEGNLEESFNRVHSRSRRIEESVKDLAADQKTFVSGTVIRWAIGLGIGVLISIIGTIRLSNTATVSKIDDIEKSIYVEIDKSQDDIHGLETLAAEKISTQRGVNINNEEKLERIEASVRYLLEKEK